MTYSYHHAISRDLYYKFPWLNGSSDILFDQLNLGMDESDQIPLPDMVERLFKQYPDVYGRMCEFFENIVLSNEQFTTPTDDIENLALYPLLQIIISMLGNRIISNALRNLYAKHCQAELIKVGAKKGIDDKELAKICQNVGIECRLNRPPKIIDNLAYPFRMDLASYLGTASKIKDKKWKLINRHFILDQIFLIRHDLVMLLREVVREKVSPNFAQITDELQKELEKIPQIKQIIEYIEELMTKHADRFRSGLFADGERVGSDLFAPCVRAILYRATQGENLSHNERLAIAFYFLNTNHTIEETVDIFRTIPDFDENIARYQVEFAAGEGGKGKKYSMYSCAKLKSLHLCYADHPQFGDPLCVKGARKRNGEIVPIHNPAGDYIFWKKVELKRLHRSQIAAGEKTIDQESDQVEEQGTKKTQSKKQQRKNKSKPNAAAASGLKQSLNNDKEGS